MLNVTFLIPEVWSTLVWSVWSCSGLSRTVDEFADFTKDVKFSTLHTVKRESRGVLENGNLIQLHEVCNVIFGHLNYTCFSPVVSGLMAIPTWCCGPIETLFTHDATVHRHTCCTLPCTDTPVAHYCAQTHLLHTTVHRHLFHTLYSKQNFKVLAKTEFRGLHEMVFKLELQWISSERRMST
jgi:hypothetical protein